MESCEFKKIEMSPIGFVRRSSPHEKERDRSLVTQIVLDKALAPALDGIEEWSHIYVIFWLDRKERKEKPVLHHPHSDLGIFAARSPIHPNPIGLTLVAFVKREENVLWVRGLDAYDQTPVLDLKPYPDWEQGLQVITDFRIPEWLRRIIEKTVQGQPIARIVIVADAPGDDARCLIKNPFSQVTSRLSRSRRSSLSAKLEISR